MPLPASRKSKAKAPKYKDSDSESDKDFEDSGSEASIPEDDDNEDSEISDEEFEEVTETVPKKKTVTNKSKKSSNAAGPKKISMDTIKRNLQSAGLRNDHSQDPLIEETKISIKDLTDKEKMLPSFLDLSESDSDSDNDSRPKRKTSTFSEELLRDDTLFDVGTQPAAGTSYGKSTQGVSGRLSDSDSECEGDTTNNRQQESLTTETASSSKLNFQRLHEETKRLEEAKQKVELYKQRQSNVGTKKAQDFNIQELLAMGEGGEGREDEEEEILGDDSDSDVEDLEEVKEVKSQSTIPKGGIQLVLDLPTDSAKKVKQIDMEMMIKRRINRVKKENQVYIHRVHVLCWLGHGNYVNTSLNDQNIMAAALSLLPSEKSYPENRVDMKYVEQITKWYHSMIIVKEDKNEHKYKPNRQSLILTLLQQISKKIVTSKKYMVYIFIALLRALGIKCRLVLSFRVVPQRPQELLSLAIKNKNEPQKDKKDVKKKGNTSKYFDSESKTDSSKDKKSSKSKKQSDSIDNIPQLDGADDRMAASSSGTRKKRNLSMNKVPNKQPKVESSPGQLSYWDQLMLNVEGTSEESNRISHKELKTEQSPYFSPPKAKTENKSKISKDIFNESTLLADIKKETSSDSIKPSRENSSNKNKSSKTQPKNKISKDIFDQSTLLANSKNDAFSDSTISFKENDTDADKTISLNSKSPIAEKTISSTSVNDSNSKRKSLSLSNGRTTRQSKKAADTVDSNKSQKTTKECITEGKIKKSDSRTPRNTRQTANKANTDPKNKQPVEDSKTPSARVSRSKRSLLSLHDEFQDVDNNEDDVEQKNENANKRINKSKNSGKTNAREKPETVDKKSDKSKSETTIKTREKQKPETANKKTETTDKKTTKAKSEAADKTTERRKSEAVVKEPEKPKSANTKTEKIKANATLNEKSDRSRKAKSNETSKYFSPGSEKEKCVTESNRRVSHRDLVVNALAAGISPQRNVRGSRNKQSNETTVKDDEEQTQRDVKGQTSTEKVIKKNRRISEMSDPDFVASKKKPLKAKSAAKDRRVLSSDDEPDPVDPKRKGVDVWCEVYLEEEEHWMCVDVVRGQLHCAKEIYSRSTHPVMYIVSWDNSSHVKDVTRRYVPHWNTTTRKLRTDPAWYDKALLPWMAAIKSAADKREDEQLDRMQMDAPLPTSIAEFKNHPLYVLKRHLLKFEAIYPPDAPPLGYIRNEPVYARECVHVCRSRETWVKEARVVKPGQEPYKIVKARPKYDRLSGNMIKDIPLEIFGPWQTEEYVPPAAENGLVPRNAYGNVELFKACMLPKGTVHLQLPGLNKVAKKLNIDCAPAMTGFDYHSGWSHPVYDGFVVCEEFKDTLIQAWEQEQEEAEARALEKVEKRVYGNWKRLIRGLFIREKLKVKYDFKDVPESSLGGGKGKKRSKGPRFLAKKRKSCEGSSDSDMS